MFQTEAHLNYTCTSLLPLMEATVRSDNTREIAFYAVAILENNLPSAFRYKDMSTRDGINDHVAFVVLLAQ